MLNLVKAIIARWKPVDNRPACEVSDPDCTRDTHRVGDLWFCDHCSEVGYARYMQKEIT